MSNKGMKCGLNIVEMQACRLDDDNDNDLCHIKNDLWSY